MGFITTPPSSVTATPEKKYNDPAHEWYGATGIAVYTAAGAGGDPFIFYDTANSRWIMYGWEASGGSVVSYYMYGNTLDTLGNKTAVASLNGYHKPVLLVDEEGVPQQVGALYHLYAVPYNGALTDKLIQHFTSPNLTGPWTAASVVIPHGAAGSLDEYNTDTPYAILKNGTINMWYMGAPASAQPTYGIAIRMLYASAANPDGPFTKTYTDVIPPSTTPGDWNYGWMGGTQIRLRPDGSYIMVYNAGDTRPPGNGQEPNTSRSGYAYATSLTGPWTNDISNPFFTPTGTPSDALEKTDIWRTHIAFEPTSQQWYAFYNCGSPNETITYARAGQYSYVYGTGAGYDVMSPTVAVQAITNSRVNLAMGNYEASITVNYIGDTAGTTPALDIETVLRLSGVAVTTPNALNVKSKAFVGYAAFQNDDFTLTYNLNVPAAGGYVDWSTQVVNGAPLATTKLRNLRVNVRRVGVPV